MVDLEAKLTAEGFERARYGWKKVLSETSVEIIIEPGKDTSGEPTDKDGLRGHPEEVWETIMHLGYVRQFEGLPEKSLLYRFRGPDGKIDEKYFGKGDVFDSVSSDPTVGVLGYWHVNGNISPALIRLRVSWGKE